MERELRVGDLRVTVLSAPGALADIEPVWRMLWGRTEPRPPMLEYEWSSRWWHLHAHRGFPFLVRVDRGDETIGLAPLYRRGRALGPRELLRTICFVGTGEPEAEEVTSENLGWLCAPDAVEAVTTGVAAVLQDHGRCWDALELRYLGPGADLAEGLAAAIAPTVLEATLRNHHCHVVEAQPFDAYVSAIASGSRRARFRKWMRKADAAGVELVRARECDDALAMFDALAELHGRRWAERGEAGACSSARFREFHRGMIRHYADTGRLWVFGLRHEGRWIALHYDIEAGDTLYYYLSGVDTEAAAKLAPGNVLLLHAIDQAAREGLRHVDLLAGSYDFKSHLATTSRQTVSLEALNRNSVARAWRVARRLGRAGAIRRAS